MDNLHCNLDLHVIMSAMSRTPRHLAVTAVITGLVLLGACSSGDDNAKPSDKVPSGNTATTDPTKTSAGPTTTPPTKTAAPQPTEQGAVATAVAAVRAIDIAYAHWDVSELRRLSLASCETCQNIIHTFPSKKAAGYTMSGGRISIIGPARVVTGNEAARVSTIRVPITVEKLVTRDPNGILYYNDSDGIGTGPAIPAGATFNILVKYGASQWKIAAAGVQQ